MIRIKCLLVVFSAAVLLLSHDSLSAQTLPQGANSGRSAGNTEVAPAASTNTLQQISVDQLAAQLQSLRLSVEQTLPVLAEFNHQMGAATNGGLAGALSGLFSGVLRKDTNANTATTSGQRLTNVLSAIGALVTTNSQGGVSVDRATLNRLASLERDLQPVAEAMRNLNLSQTNMSNIPPATPAGGFLTPTGR